MTVFILIGILGGIGVLFVLSKGESLQEYENLSGLLKPFYRIGKWTASRIGKFPVFSGETKRLQILRPSENAEENAHRFLAEKLAISFLILFGGCIFAILVSLKDGKQGSLQEGYRLDRREYQDGKYTAYLTAELGEEFSQEIEVIVEERQYTEEEIEEMLPAFHEALEKNVLGENVSADRIDRKVVLAESIDGYPFRIKWSSSNDDTLDRYGILGEAIPENGELVVLSAEISYRDYQEIYSFPLMVYPAVLSREEQIGRDLQKLLDEMISRSEEEKEMFLPQEVDGIRIVWQEKKQQNALILLALAVGSSIAVFWGKNNELDRKIKDRNEQMLLDYPEIVSKMTLFIGAGMTVRGAWKKVVMDYRQRREKEQAARYVYEEMQFTLYEMESGVSELEAYQRFASRCQVQKYVKFIALLEQNVKLGAKGFLAELNREAKDAFEERKSTAKQLGETAGSKLMLPMFLMLGIVMVVIMVPCFLSMGM